MQDAQAAQGKLLMKPVTSGYLVLWVLVVHLGAFGVIWPLALPSPLKLALALFMVWHLLRDTRLHLLKKSAKSLVRLSLESDDQWQLEFRDGCKARAALSAHTLVTPWLMVLSFNGLEGTCRRASLVLFPDSLDKELSRRLRMRLLRLRADDSNR